MTTTPAQRTWPDLAGRLISDAGVPPVHVMPVRVYFEDTDAGAVAYHASYVRWCERGRTDFLRLLGSDARQMINGTAGHEPAAFVVRKMTFDFLRPARMDDVLEVTTRVVAIGGASVTLNQAISRGETRIAEADVTVVLVSAAGKPLRISSAMRLSMGAGEETAAGTTP
jgi:acyl-CoA thioester hydrolase